MKNSLLYLITVIIWGSTWFAIEFQLGDVDVIASVTYRFGISAIIMWLYCWIARVSLKFNCRDHGFIILLALFNFSLNYVLIYSSQQHLSSAMTSIGFTSLLLMNIINTSLFFGKRIARRVYFGALLGISGLIAIFWHDLQAQTAANTNTMLGLILVLASTLTASLGNMVSVRNSRNGVNILAANAWGMLYGTLALTLIVLLSDAQFSFSTQTSYIASLLYLSVFGTVIAFATYYILLNNMGPEKASYVIVLFPIVAVLLGSLFEGFVWDAYTFFGFALVLIGNAILVKSPRRWFKLNK